MYLIMCFANSFNFHYLFNIPVISLIFSLIFSLFRFVVVVSFNFSIYSDFSSFNLFLYFYLPLFQLICSQDMATFRIAALQKSLDDSVPELELQIVNKKYNELTSKYRDLLQQGNHLISKSTAVENLEVISSTFGISMLNMSNAAFKRKKLN